LETKLQESQFSGRIHGCV